MKGSYLKYLLLSFSMVLGVSSCVNLKYTDYGKPFDFLKAKNTHFKSAKSVLDTANVFQIKYSEELEFLALEEPLDSIVFMDEPVITFSTENVINDVQKGIPMSDSLLAYKLIPPDSSDLIDQRIPVLSAQRVERVSKSNLVSIKYSPPEWWRNMWRAVWKFFLKWLLIAILVAVVLIGIVLGVTALALWIGGPVAAAITCIVLLVVIQIVFDVDLSWLLNFF